MAVRSLGFRTDLMLLQLQGAVVQDHGNHHVVRTPGNPSFWWGNFLLLGNPPSVQVPSHWVPIFRQIFPAASHVAIGVDSTTPIYASIQGTELELIEDVVLTAASVLPPPPPTSSAKVRKLDTDDDWRAAEALHLVNAMPRPDDTFRLFVRRKLTALRSLQERGCGATSARFRMVA